MTKFAKVVDQLAATLEQGDASVASLVDALKRAEGDLFRVDQDAPAAGEAYVIRIEHADGRRLKSVIPSNRVPADGEVLLAVLTSLARGVATTLLTAQGIQAIQPDVQTFTEQDLRQAAKAQQ